jgi:hypothetical protein
LFRFWDFDDLNKKDQTELKKKFSLINKTSDILNPNSRIDSFFIYERYLLIIFNNFVVERKDGVR